jgi:glycosyltransferase involved in cell wall biosynthesis
MGDGKYAHKKCIKAQDDLKAPESIATPTKVLASMPDEFLTDEQRAEVQDAIDALPQETPPTEKIQYLLTRPNLDIVFYTEGMKFDPEVVATEALGGSESSAYLLCHAFASLGHRVRLYCLTDRPGLHDGVEYIPAEMFPEYDGKADVLIISRFIPTLHQKNADAKCVTIWLHDLLSVEWAQHLIQQMHKVDFIAVNTLWAKNQATAPYALGPTPEKNMFIIRNSIDYPLVREVLGKGLVRNPNRIMYTSRPERGLMVLLSAWPRLKAGNPNLELYICAYVNPMMVGDPRQEKIESEIKVKLEELNDDSIHILDPMPKHKLYEELAQTTLLVYPSIFPETSCLSAIEAMALGAVPVCASYAALTETVRDRETGWLIDGNPVVLKSSTKDLGAWYDIPHTNFQVEMVGAVIRLLSNPIECDRLRIGGMMHAQWYNVQLVAQEWVAKIYAVLDRADHAQTVTACVILRDDEDMVLGMLNSIEPQVDAIRVLIDTRSKDSTKAICESFSQKTALPMEVVDYEWTTDSFGDARNKSIEGVTTHWIFWIDGDEKLVGDIRPYLRTNAFNGYNVAQLHLVPEGQRTDWPVRLFRNGINVQFFGTVHEQPELVFNRSVPKNKPIDPKIIHYGYAGGDQLIPDRWWRNHALVKADLSVNPDREITWYVYMRDIIYYCDRVVEREGKLVDELIPLLNELLDVCWPRFANPSNLWHLEAFKLHQRAMVLLDYPCFYVAIAGTHSFDQIPEGYSPPVNLVRFRSREEVQAFVGYQLERVFGALYPAPVFPHREDRDGG